MSLIEAELHINQSPYKTIAFLLTADIQTLLQLYEISVGVQQMKVTEAGSFQDADIGFGGRGVLDNPKFLLLLVLII